MGLYNFKEQFAPFILDGRKTHTIRAIRAHPDKPGNILHLYTGLRTKRCTFLMRAGCVAIEHVMIRIAHDGPQIDVAGVQLDHTERQALAVRDGFQNFDEMMGFWYDQKRTFPWSGHIIHWRRVNETTSA